MASNDVIEVVSSDDEAGPAPKSKNVIKNKIKPKSNAMVHIPNKLPGVTIKSSKGVVLNKSASLNLNNKKTFPIRVQPGGTTTSIVQNPYANNVSKKGPNGQIKIGPVTVLQKPIPVFRNDFEASKQLKIKQVPPLLNPINIVNRIPLPVKTPIAKIMRHKRPPAVPQVKGDRCLNSLPPGLTITRTSQMKRKRPPISMVPAASLIKKPKLNPLSQIGDVLTVELDEEDSNQTSANPVWYMKPEEATQSLKEQNNKEPEPAKFIEITIEDSPIKPPLNKHTFSDSAITISDSPVKPLTEKNKPHEALSSGSDDERELKNKTPNSKKKLVYPKNDRKNQEVNNDINSNANDLLSCNVIEIEIDPIDYNQRQEEKSEEKTEENLKDNEKSSTIADDKVFEILESPKKPKEPKEANDKTTPKKKITSKESQSPTKAELHNKDKDVKEFHPVYQNFIDLCFKLENSDDMKKIVEKKIKTYYRQVPKDYTESEEFIEMVSSKIVLMTAAPEKMYLFIKDVVDELNMQRKMAKSQAANEEKAKEMEATAFYGEEIEQDSKRKRQVRKLEKTLKKLHRAIQKLEEQEVDFDDEGDSVYLLVESEDDTTETTMDKSKPIERDREILLQRYKERLVRVHAKLCQLSNTKMPSEPRVHLEPRPGRPAGPARRLERFVNRRVAGVPLPFPDFHDVLRCVREANEEDKLDWNEAVIMEEARDLFTRCGKKLQRRRQEQEWRIAASRITGGLDPAEESEELKKKLDDNRKTAALKETEVINKFADRQQQLNLEAVEIGEKEAEESPVDSGDEAKEEDNLENEDTLEDSEKRKERLKRLIKEKSKNFSDSNTNSPVNDEVMSGNEKNKMNVKEKNKSDEEILPQVTKTNTVSVSVDSTDVIMENVEKSVEIDLKNKEVEIEICAQNDNVPKVDARKSGSLDSILLSSDDSKKVDSDVDELHLLQKLHSSTILASSTCESSDTDNPIAISDTLESSDDIENKNKNQSDVVSIENSSESDVNRDTEDNEMDVDEGDENDCRNEDDNEMNDVEMKCENNEPKLITRNSNEEYTKPVEDILLASSEDDESRHDAIVEKVTESNTEGSSDSNDQNNCINLKDDSISIGETIVQGSNKTSQNLILTETLSTDSQESVQEDELKLSAVELKTAPVIESNLNIEDLPDVVLDGSAKMVENADDKRLNSNYDNDEGEAQETGTIEKLQSNVGELSPGTAELQREISILCESEINDLVDNTTES